MLDFKNKLEKTIVDYFVGYCINPHPINDGRIVDFDGKNQIHYTNSLASASNLNVAISKNLETQEQIDKALAIISEIKKNNMPFTWFIISNSKEQKEKAFFLGNGFHYSETTISMIYDLKQLDEKIELNENEKINAIASLEDVEKFRTIVKSAFPISIIDLQKYYGFYQLRKEKGSDFDYQVYLTVDGSPASSGHLFFTNGLAIIDDIATSPSFQKRGLAKKMMFHLLNVAKDRGYQQVALFATESGYPLYEKIGFKAIDLFFDIYEINYH